MKNKIYAGILSGILLLSGCIQPEKRSLQSEFFNPPMEYRPMPFWHINGTLTTEGITERLENARNLSGFGGVAVLPVNSGGQWGSGSFCPGTAPLFLSPAYFDRYKDILQTSQQLGTEVILYDDIDFPSGTAGGELSREYPHYTKKFLHTVEWEPQENTSFKQTVDLDENSLFVCLSALNKNTKEVKDLSPFLENNIINWQVPEGEWKVLLFYCRYNAGERDHVDFMQPEAVATYMQMTYQKYEEQFSSYFGNVIKKSFYDDVGFVHEEHSWTPAISDIFREKYSKNPALYYPALFYNIGEETHQARIAFFDIRSELMAEGYVKAVGEWAERNKLKSIGHPPENYSPNSSVASGDILKYYRHTHIPLLDAIFYYGRGLHGYKQISSAADRDDKPVVGAELCGAFPANMDSMTLFRTAMEAIVRGVNFVVPHGMWYTTDADKIRIPPLISHENPLLAASLPHYSEYIGRCCRLLQGGQRISEIALLWPITSIQAESYIHRDDRSPLPVANWLPNNVIHHQISDLLTNQLHRDFTFIHPEDMCNGKITADKDVLTLNNRINSQHYKLLIIPGGDVISYGTLQAIKTYYEGGGKVLFLSSLPFKSAEFGQGQQVKEIIKELLHTDPETNENDFLSESNNKGGKILFSKKFTSEKLKDLFGLLELVPDVQFPPIATEHQVGHINYLHKINERKHIYFFTNTTENPFFTHVYIKGKLKNPEIWNPHTGEICQLNDMQYLQSHTGESVTQIPLLLPSVSSLFILAEAQ